MNLLLAISGSHLFEPVFNRDQNAVSFGKISVGFTENFDGTGDIVPRHFQQVQPATPVKQGDLHTSQIECIEPLRSQSTSR